MATMNYELAKGLDKALTYLCQGNTDVNGIEWYTNNIHNKLTADGYIVIKRQVDYTVMEVAATDRGHVFYANGGYTKQLQDIEFLEEERLDRKKDRCDQKINRWLSFAAIAVSAICAIIQLIITCIEK